MDITSRDDYILDELDGMLLCAIFIFANIMNENALIKAHHDTLSNPLYSTNNSVIGLFI